MQNNIKIDNTNRAILVQTLGQISLSQYCLRMISNIVVRSRNKESVARSITEILNTKQKEHDIIDQLQLWYGYVV